MKNIYIILIAIVCQPMFANQNVPAVPAAKNVCVCPSSIEKIQSYKEIDFDAIQPGSLVVFDVDDTLIQPVDTIFTNSDTSEAKKFWGWLDTKGIDAGIYLPILQHWQMYEAKSRLIEPSIIGSIEQLKARGIPVIACTFINTGHGGGLKFNETMEQWRYNHLKSLGFEGSYNTKVLKFTIDNKHPVFYKGILATDKIEKGKAIGAFLDTINLHPHTIYMFDDREDFLESVQKECICRGIVFKGYQYQGAASKPWDEELVRFQGEYFIKHKRWLSDEEAKKKMRIKRTRIPKPKIRYILPEE